MAKFEVKEIFRLPSKQQYVIAGKVLEGKVHPGMTALVWLDSEAFWSIAVKGVEYIDRASSEESLVGLLCEEVEGDEAAICQSLAPPGSVIEVRHG